MINDTSRLATVDEYIARFPVATQQRLAEVRALVKAAAPDAEEKLSYQMPAYKYHGVLVYFAGYAHHIGFYPGAAAITRFQTEISGYKNARGSVQFPPHQPLPAQLITRMVLFKVQQNLVKAAMKKKK